MLVARPAFAIAKGLPGAAVNLAFGVSGSFLKTQTRLAPGRASRSMMSRSPSPSRSAIAPSTRSSKSPSSAIGLLRWADGRTQAFRPPKTTAPLGSMGTNCPVTTLPAKAGEATTAQLASWGSRKMGANL